MSSITSPSDAVKSGGSIETKVRPPNLERGRGFIDHIEYQNGRLIMTGWMFVRDHAFDDFALKLNGTPHAGARLVERPDVREAFSNISSAARCGFYVDTSLNESDASKWIDLDVVGVSSGKEVAVISTSFVIGFRDGINTPPGRLMQRVANTESPANYWTSALTSFGEYRHAMRRHVAEATIGRLLDWGCGCGRMTSLFLKHSSIAEIHGCDIDTEAVVWCRTNLPKGSFGSIPLYPPTAYPSEFFGAIVSYSVFTHLVRDVQISWLKEMRRILRPGGYFFASCHGDFATSFSDAIIQDEVRRDGISDGTHDSHLDGVAPTDYYRATFQSQAYTVAEFGKHFRVVEYLPRAVASFQDLIVLQKT